MNEIFKIFNVNDHWTIRAWHNDGTFYMLHVPGSCKVSHPSDAFVVDKGTMDKCCLRCGEEAPEDVLTLFRLMSL